MAPRWSGGSLPQPLNGQSFPTVLECLLLFHKEFGGLALALLCGQDRQAQTQNVPSWLQLLLVTTCSCALSQNNDVWWSGQASTNTGCF